MNLYRKKEQPNSEPKPSRPAAVIAIQAGLHPASKTVQALLGNNKRKPNG